MTVALDTSVVLRLLTGEPPHQMELARRALEQADAPVHVGALVVSESYFVLRHHYKVPHDRAVSALLQLLTSEKVTTNAPVREALVAARDTSEPGLMDRLILAEARNERVPLITFDQWLSQLDGAQLVR